MPRAVLPGAYPLYWSNSARSLRSPLTAPMPTVADPSTSWPSAAQAEPKAASSASITSVGLVLRFRMDGFLVMLASPEEESRRRVGGRRVVGAVHLGVAVQARAALPDVHDVLAAGRGSHGRGRLPGLRRREHVGLSAQRPHVAGRVRRVAFLAQHRRARLQHRLGGAAVRVVADRAVLRDRLVREDERSALLGVAGVAGVVDAVALDQLRAGRAVHVVA